MKMNWIYMFLPTMLCVFTYQNSFAITNPIIDTIEISSKGV